MCEAVLSILNGKGMNSSLNSTFIALVPKKHAAKFASDFQPISLCNVLYKIFSKTITNKLKPFMHSIISNNQSTFILGRLISDNILVAHEMLYSMKKEKKGKVEKLAVRLDISKAYDRVEWSYIKVVLKTLSIKTQWIRLVMSRISTINYSILVFCSLKGFRQGDHLSPYLFLMCAEGLSYLINKFEKKGEVQGLTVSRGGRIISHFLFIDVNILFCKVTVEE